ncbi:hypothetical protein BC629DRAFT_346939 [Irpex lacteus]|nr:hypothetical protein BC629DRAFT_346939 [Irpex lacteus]
MIRGSNYLEATAVRNTVRPTGLGQDSCYTQIRIRYCEANVVIDMVLVTQPTLATMRFIPSAWYRIVKCSEITGLRIETRAAKTAQQPDIRSSHRTNLDGPTLHMQGRNNEHVFHHHALGVWSSDQSEPLPKPSHRLRHALLKSIYSHVYRANPPRLRNYTYIPRCSYSSVRSPTLRCGFHNRFS